MTKRHAAMLSAAALIASSFTLASPVVGSASAADFCNRNTYETKVRAVTGVQDIGINRMWVRTYPGRTTISSGETVTTNHRTTLQADVGSTIGASVGAGAMLKKVVNVFAEAHADTNYKVSITDTSGDSATVVNQTTVVIPAGKTVVWFVGHKTVTGTFEYSSCNALDGSDPVTGVVKWRSSTWKSFDIRDDGGQRCDLAANTSVARAAKQIGCS